VGNNSGNNGSGVGDGAGVFVTGNGNRIEGNNVTFNDRGIDVNSSANLIVRNSARSNTLEYDIAAGNAMGPIVTTGNVDTDTSPNANFDF
jgi:parallel beta-helix repeat protein